MANGQPVGLPESGGRLVRGFRYDAGCETVTR